jgi:hypothetical protein
MTAELSKLGDCKNLAGYSTYSAQTVYLQVQDFCHIRSMYVCKLSMHLQRRDAHYLWRRITMEMQNPSGHDSAYSASRRPIGDRA